MKINRTENLTNEVANCDSNEILFENICEAINDMINLQKDKSQKLLLFKIKNSLCTLKQKKDADFVAKLNLILADVHQLKDNELLEMYTWQVIYQTKRNNLIMRMFTKHKLKKVNRIIERIEDVCKDIQNMAGNVAIIE